MTVGVQGKRLLLLNDDAPLVGELMRRLRAAGAELFMPPNPTSAARDVDGQRLDGVIAFFDPQRKGVLPFAASVRGSERNGRTPVSVIASEVEAESVKRLCALGVASLIVAPAGADDVVHRLERALAAPAAKPKTYDVRRGSLSATFDPATS